MNLGIENTREGGLFILYLMTNVKKKKQYIGSTTEMYGRWLNHKSDCNRGVNSCGLSAHFAMGCPGDTSDMKTQLWVTLLDYMDVTETESQNAKHGGVGCLCKLCDKLKDIENKWVMTLGCFYFPGGLNSREELKRKIR